MDPDSLRSPISCPAGQATRKEPLLWLGTMAELQQQASGDVSLDFGSPDSLSSVSSSSSHATLSPRSNPISSRSPERARLNEDEDEDGFASSSSQSSSHMAKKSKIALDPCQPLTAKGKPRARVYVACHECRSRKIRCDGAKPVCFNCQRRDHTLTRCDYDTAPKRRGQDKVPGSRTRSAVGQRAPRRAPRCDASDADGRSSYGRLGNERSNTRWRFVRAPLLNFEAIVNEFDPSTFDVTAAESYRLPSPRPLEDNHEDENSNGYGNSETAQLPSEPNMRFARETWWDALLTFYAAQDRGQEIGKQTLSVQERLATTHFIFADIRALLRASVYWASFLHLPRFFETILEPERRMNIQPALFLSMLAVGAYAQSSDLKAGSKGRIRALKLIELAYSALQASLASNWVDIGLVQAAWFMTYFEVQGHPAQTMDRCRESMCLLDSLIRLFSLTALDADRPFTQYRIFATCANDDTSHSSAVHEAHHEDCNVPINPSLAPQTVPHTPPAINPGASSPSCSAQVVASCSCAKYTLKEQWPTVSVIAPPWETTTMWPNQMAECEIRKEECRRLVWSSVMLTTGHNSFTASLEGGLTESSDLFIKDYRNFSLLFPGQALCLSGITPVDENNVWNLCLRAMLLWQTSTRYRSDESLTEQEKARFATNAWLEADAIEVALDKHTCNLEDGMMHQAREFLFTSRMSISHEFRQFAPGVNSNGIMQFYRTKAEGWLRTQMWVTRKLWEGLQNDPYNELGNRPLLMWWFMGHIVRALVLWKADHTLLLALDACKVFAQPLEYLLRLWPCRDQIRKWQGLRYELVNACLTSGVPPPVTKLPPTVTEMKNAYSHRHEPGPSRSSAAGTL